jgi:hypothetical protein
MIPGTVEKYNKKENCIIKQVIPILVYDSS